MNDGGGDDDDGGGDGGGGMAKRGSFTKRHLRTSSTANVPNSHASYLFHPRERSNQITNEINPPISPTSPETESICQWHNGPPRRWSRGCPKFRTGGGVGNRRWGKNSGNGHGMETADGEADLGSFLDCASAVVEKALRTAPKTPPS